jgi:aspartate kinase
VGLIIKKYGGATLATPEKIKAVAHHLANRYKTGESLIVVVSAMGKTTNSLIELANQVSHNPPRREMDMLLSTGERISMSLLSMALNDLGCPAISFTGSQAGILTDEAHANALIIDIKAHRIEEALKRKKLVILAGFQGVSPHSKEITTLGRGGSDTTAVAMAAAFNANRCEILKDVPAVFSADPNLISEAQALHHISYQQLLEMTFWGAKVLHYRSVELAMLRKVNLYIGPAHAHQKGTKVSFEISSTGEKKMFEANRVLSFNSHENVLCVNHRSSHSADVLAKLRNLLDIKEINFPQILNLESDTQGTTIYFTAPSEVITAIERSFDSLQDFKLIANNLATISATCTGNSTSVMAQVFLKELESHNIPYLKLFLNGMTITLLLNKNNRDSTLKILHSLIHKADSTKLRP